MEVLRKLFPYLKKYTVPLTFSILGVSLFTGLSLIPPLLMRYLINDIIETGVWDLLLPVIILITFVPIATAAINFVNSRLIMKTGYKFIADLRRDIYGKILRLSMKFHQDTSSGLLVNRLMDDVNMIQQLITGTTVTLFTDIIIFVFSVTIVFSLSPVLFSVLIAIMVLYVLAYRFFSKKIRSESNSFRSMNDRISERLQETVSGTRHVRIFNREPWENTMFLSRTNQSLQHSLSSNVNSISLSTACTMIAGFGSAAVAAIGASFVIRGRLQYGDVLAITTYMWMALNPAIRLTTVAGQITETFVSAKRVIEILEEPVDVKSVPNAEKIVRGNGRVDFKNIYFSYVPEVPLYQDLNLQVDPGQTVALVGHTGCGKTTLTSLLMRYWDIQKGRILIDGHDIRKVELDSLRQLFGVVLQDPIIFDGTVRENITYGIRGATDEMVQNAAKAAEIYEMTAALPEGFDTFLGTRGVKLSVGEKQRLSIARAVIKDPLIMIMDEATSSLDSESEALIQKALKKILKDRTSFVVAHRLSTITTADLIVVMDKGRIVEKGTHQKLMEIDNGHYRQLYEELQGKGQDT
jgi:subfamily B ATP-binding cassette protein MsbA